MDSTQKAAVAEHRVIARALEFGFTVSIPVTTARYDLLLERHGEFFRTQVKYGGHAPSHSIGACRVSFNCWGGSGGKRSRTYETSEIAMMLAYLPDADEIIEIPARLYEGRQSVILRIQPAANGQTKNINLVEDLVWTA